MLKINDVKSYIKRKLNGIYFYRLLAYQIHKYNVTKDPKAEANRSYYPFFRKKIDWENPTNLIEKIHWLQLYTDTDLWTKYADKYLVREYVKDCGYGNHLPQLYGKWEEAKEIDFNKLPQEFVLKTN